MRKVTPILFSAPMVLAILREIEKPGTGKTQTRRILKPQPVTFQTDYGESSVSINVCDYHQRPRLQIGRVITEQDIRFATGDVLWVRETWCRGPVGRDGIVDDWSDFAYRASNPEIEGIDDGDGYAELNADCSIKSCWKPSIHMPRAASRLTLDVTDVRVQRLQDISDADAIAEGVATPPFHEMTCDLDGCPGCPSARVRFRNVWIDIHGKGTHDSSWASNPFVVAISFRPHLINVDAFLKQQEAA